MVTCGHWDLGHGHENLQFSNFLKWGTHLSSSKIIQNPLLSIKNEWLGLPIVLEATMWTWSLHWNVLNLCELGKLGNGIWHPDLRHGVGLNHYSPVEVMICILLVSIYGFSPSPGNTLWNWDSPCCKISGGFVLQKKTEPKKYRTTINLPLL